MTDKPTYVFATNNAHKIDEVRQIVGDEIKILSLNDIGCSEDIPENEKTLEGNALAKAKWVKIHYGYDCFADDTGLEVDALGGEPGVRSARYAPGEGHDSVANMRLLLKKLDGKTDRRAQFRTVVAFLAGDEVYMFEGKVKGTIAEKPSGTQGFGYDPVFVPEGDTRSFAEYAPEEKNAISHRGRAMSAMLEFLRKRLSEKVKN